MSTTPRRRRIASGLIATPGRRFVLAVAIAVVSGQLLAGPRAGDAAPPNTVTSVNAASTTGATTSAAFTAGVGYRILAAGTYSVAAPTGGVLPGTVPPVTTGDANCFGGQPDASRELQVWAAGQRLAVLWRSWTSAQRCDPADVYYFDYVGTGVPLTFILGSPTGNSGVLTVYTWAANPAGGASCATIPPPGALAESDLYGQSAFADPSPSPTTITYGDGQTRSLTSAESTAGDCSAANHSFSNGSWACNSRFPNDNPGDPNRVSLLTGELSSASWPIDSYTNIFRSDPNAYPSTWWQQTGHGGFHSCNDQVAGATYTITARGDYAWEARVRPGELGDAMCSTPTSTSMVYDPNLGGVYVADQGLDTVSEVLASGQVVHDPFGAAPDTHPGLPHLYPSQPGLAVDPGTHMLYVADEGSPWYGTDASGNNSAGGIHAVDQQTGTISAISLGEPQHVRNHNLTSLAVDPATNMVYAVNNLLGSLSVIDGNRGSATFDTVVAQVVLDGESASYYVAVDPALDLIYLTAYDTKTLFTIDGHSNMLVGKRIFTDSLGDLAVDPATHDLYVLDETNGGLLVVNPLAGSQLPQSVTIPRTVAGMPPTVSGVAVMPGNASIPTHVYVAVDQNGADSNTHDLPGTLADGQVVVIDPAAGTVVATLTRPAGGSTPSPDPERLAVDPTSRTVYVGNSTSHTVSLLSDTATGISQRSLALVAATQDAAGVHPTTHWMAERNPYFALDTWRNQGYWQSLWVDQLDWPGEVAGGVVTDAGSTVHWVPAVPAAGNPECAGDADHTYTLTYTAPVTGPMKFWIYDYYYYESASFGDMSITLTRTS